MQLDASPFSPRNATSALLFCSGISVECGKGMSFNEPHGATPSRVLLVFNLESDHIINLIKANVLTAGSIQTTALHSQQAVSCV